MTDPLEQFEQQIKRHQPAPLSDELVKRVLDESDRRSDEEAKAKRMKFPVWAPVAVAACLIITLSIWIVNTGPTTVTPPNPPGVTLASGWRINATGDADFKVVNPYLIELNRGEIEVARDDGSESAEPFSIQTAEGKATTQNATCFIGSHADQEKGSEMKSLTRVLVLTGSVMLTNPLGTATGGSNELIAATKAEAPTKVVVKTNTDFAIDLYQRLSKENNGINLFFSPYSVSSALAMTAEGARGKTAKEMGTVLRFPKAAMRIGNDAQSIPWKTATIHTGMGQLNKQFNRKDKAYQLHVANALWAEQTFPFRPEFTGALAGPYGAAVNPANFIGNPEGERTRINDWVEQKTNNRIKELLKPGLIVSDTRLVLTNAIFFKGDWLVQFKEKHTTELPFTLADGKKVKTKMMYHNEDAEAKGEKGKAPFRYQAFDAKGNPVKNLWQQNKVDFEILEMPYQGKELAMVVLLPRKTDGLAKLESGLTSAKLNQWIGQLKRNKLNIRFPRFKMETKFSLKKTLIAMGMPSAFQSGGFTGMSDSSEARKLYIAAVEHKAFVEVNEKGTEAAAATAVVVNIESAGPFVPSFIANRPFVFLIRDNATGSVLFMGRMMNPAAK